MNLANRSNYLYEEVLINYFVGGLRLNI